VQEKPWYEQLEEKHLQSLFSEAPPQQWHHQRRKIKPAHEAHQDLFVQFSEQISEKVDVCHQKLNSSNSDFAESVSEALA
jgi:hypothetical protein